MPTRLFPGSAAELHARPIPWVLGAAWFAAVAVVVVQGRRLLRARRGSAPH